MNHGPAFQFYPADFLVGTAHMNADEVGGYMRLLCYQWLKGGIENTDENLLGLGGCKRESLSKIKAKFVVSKRDGLLRNKRLEKVRKMKLDFAASRSRNAVTRWEQKRLADARALQVHSKCNALQSSSSSLLVSLVKERNGTTEPEKEFLVACLEVFGEKNQRAWGGYWRKLYRQNSGKAIRVLNAVREDLKTKQIANPGGYAKDLWERFAD